MTLKSELFPSSAPGDKKGFKKKRLTQNVFRLFGTSFSIFFMQCDEAYDLPLSTVPCFLARS